LCYRYTIPQELLNDINELCGRLGNARGRIRSNPAHLAPFYPLPAPLGKRAAMGLVQGGPGKSAAMGGAISVAVGAGGA
jgi:hypothetical protein